MNPFGLSNGGLMGSRKVSFKPQNPPAPVPGSGEFPLTETVRYLQEKGWRPFKFEGTVRWIDPENQYDVSYSEEEALRMDITRTHPFRLRPKT